MLSTVGLVVGEIVCLFVKLLSATSVKISVHTKTNHTKSDKTVTFEFTNFESDSLILGFLSQDLIFKTKEKQKSCRYLILITRNKPKIFLDKISTIPKTQN